jgi:hypothetical protein
MTGSASLDPSRPRQTFAPPKGCSAERVAALLLPAETTASF